MKIIKRENVFNGYYRLDQLEIKSQKSDKVSQREQFIVPNSVGILVYNTAKKKIILVRQFRVGPEKEVTEIVAGKIDKDEIDPIETARREVLEEVGYSIDKLTEIHRFYTCPGPVTECMQLYYAEVSIKKEKGGGVEEENEEIEILEMNIDQFLKRNWNDAKTIIAQQWLKLNGENALRS